MGKAQRREGGRLFLRLYIHRCISRQPFFQCEAEACEFSRDLATLSCPWLVGVNTLSIIDAEGFHFVDSRETCT